MLPAAPDLEGVGPSDCRTQVSGGLAKSHACLGAVRWGQDMLSAWGASGLRAPAHGTQRPVDGRTRVQVVSGWPRWGTSGHGLPPRLQAGVSDRLSWPCCCSRLPHQANARESGQGDPSCVNSQIL